MTNPESPVVTALTHLINATWAQYGEMTPWQGNTIYISFILRRHTNVMLGDTKYLDENGHHISHHHSLADIADALFILHVLFPVLVLGVEPHHGTGQQPSLVLIFR